MSPPVRRSLTRAEALTLAAALTILAIALPASVPVHHLYQHFQTVPWFDEHYSRFADLCLIAVGLMLTLPAPRESGLRIGNVREHWKGVLLLTTGPVLGCAIVYPLLPEQPFKGSDV